MQSCAKRTSLGFEEYMGAQIGQPISDVYKNGFQPTNVYKDEKTKETYYTFVKDGGFYSRSRGHIGKSRYYYGSSMGINLYCNIIWIVDENGIRTGYKRNGNDCFEYEISSNIVAADSVVTVPAKSLINFKAE